MLWMLFNCPKIKCPAVFTFDFEQVKHIKLISVLLNLGESLIANVADQ